MDIKGASKETSSNSALTSDATNVNVSAAASFKKLQPEEFYRHHIEKVFKTNHF